MLCISLDTQLAKGLSVQVSTGTLASPHVWLTSFADQYHIFFFNFKPFKYMHMFQTVLYAHILCFFFNHKNVCIEVKYFIS